jgi:hypothetical protein
MNLRLACDWRGNCLLRCLQFIYSVAPRRFARDVLTLELICGNILILSVAAKETTEVEAELFAITRLVILESVR